MPAVFTAQAGFARPAVSGDLALADGAGGSFVEQDIGSAFGLGEQQGSPYVRAQADLGLPVVTASGFWLRESGTGVLDDSFGGLPAGTPVTTDLELFCAKISCTFDLDLGPVKVSPGLAFDVFDLEFRATESLLGNREEIDELLAVPLLFMRAEAGLGQLGLVTELGFVEIPGSSTKEGRLLDFEAMLEWPILPLTHVFAGYRFLDIDVSGETGTESFGADLQIRGWFVGGGVRL